MSRINTNIQSLTAIHALQRNQGSLSLALQRLSTGLQINSGKDNPAGLIASEQLRSEITGINQAIDNSQRARNVLQTADGALSEVSGLLIQLQGLTNQAANTGGLSPDEIKANQLQVDAILNSINRISNTTQFNGVRLLNGSLDYTTSGLNAGDVTLAQINASQIPDNGHTTVTVQVTGSAKLANVGFTASGIGAAPTTIEIGGSLGAQQISFAASAHNSSVVVAINQYKSSTGVSASLSGAQLRLSSTSYGSSQFVSVKAVSGSFATTAAKAFGADARVNINGSVASTNGLVASLRTGDNDINLTLSPAFAQQTTQATSFSITGGGAKFQLGSQVNSVAQTDIGIASVATSSLGNRVDGFLSSLGTGGANSLVGGATTAAQVVITDAINQVADLRGRLGALQKDVIDTNVNSLNVALENVTASESHIRDADFAAETANLTRSQILVQANTSVLSQANSSPQSVLKLLGA